MSTIDLTPSWRTAIEICIIALEAGTETGKELARGELRDMADNLDQMLREQAPDPSEIRDRLRTRPNHWEEQPGHPVEDWQAEVANRDTALGYLEWCEARRLNARDGI